MKKTLYFLLISPCTYSPTSILSTEINTQDRALEIILGEEDNSKHYHDNSSDSHIIDDLKISTELSQSSDNEAALPSNQSTNKHKLEGQQKPLKNKLATVNNTPLKQTDIDILNEGELDSYAPTINYDHVSKPTSYNQIIKYDHNNNSSKQIVTLNNTTIPKEQIKKHSHQNIPRKQEISHSDQNTPNNLINNIEKHDHHNPANNLIDNIIDNHENSNTPNNLTDHQKTPSKQKMNHEVKHNNQSRINSANPTVKTSNVNYHCTCDCSKCCNGFLACIHFIITHCFCCTMEYKNRVANQRKINLEIKSKIQEINNQQEKRPVKYYI